MRRILFIAFLFITGCTDFPKDSAGTLKDVQNDTLHVGISHNRHYTHDTNFINRFARQVNAAVVWTHTDQHHLVELIKDKELDLVAGGFTKDCPYTEDVAFTKPYRTIDKDGKKQEYVLGVQNGENAFLMELEKFIHHETGKK